MIEQYVRREKFVDMVKYHDHNIQEVIEWIREYGLRVEEEMVDDKKCLVFWADLNQRTYLYKGQILVREDGRFWPYYSDDFHRAFSRKERRVIDFYYTQDTYGVFSNFYCFHITIDNERWPSTEHYYQAQKFLDESTQQKIRCCNTPSEAALIGRDKNNTMRLDWDKVKDDVMLKAIQAKFNQFPQFRKLLLLTEDAILVERTSNDSYWGDGGNGIGKNMLGVVLMQVRDDYAKL